MHILLKSYLALSLFTLSTILGGCGIQNEVGPEEEAIETPVSGTEEDITLLAFPQLNKMEAILLGNKENVGSVLMGVASDGSMTVLDETRLEVSRVLGLRGGFLMLARSKKDQAKKDSLYFVHSDGKITALLKKESKESLKLDQFLGQNTELNLFFAQGEVFDYEKRELSQLNLSLASTFITGMSGNFLKLSGKNQNFIYDTRSTKKFSFRECAGMQIAALSNTRLLVDDCEVVKILDVGGGQKLDTQIVEFRAPLFTRDGSLVTITESNPALDGLPSIFLVTGNDTITSILNDEVTLDIEMFGSYLGDYYVIKEGKSISWAKKPVKQRHSILSQLKIIQVSVADDLLFYQGKTTAGAEVFGMYDMAKTKNTELKDGAISFSQLESISK